MIAITSKSAGIILFSDSDSTAHKAIGLVDGLEKGPSEASHVYSLVDDWEEIKGDDEEVLLREATSSYWQFLTISLFQFAISGMEESLEARVLEEIEDILSKRVSSKDTLNHLLIAPLRDASSLETLAKSALSRGLSATASILDELHDLQPLLQKFTDVWLMLPNETFSNIPDDKGNIWVTLVESIGMSDVLYIDNGAAFEKKWNLLPFCFTEVQTRSGLGAIGRELSSTLFPTADAATTTNVSQESERREEAVSESRVIDDHEAYIRTKKEIYGVVKEVSKGRNRNAERFLKDLIDRQTSNVSDKVFAVKSLCHIAKRCAEIFRTDFELMCLNKALELDSTDVWALIQQADAYKRVELYGEAHAAISKAIQLKEGVVGQSVKADIYSEQGNYAAAIKIYTSIAEWSEKPQILTAIADNYRKDGQMDKAEKHYFKAIDSSREGISEASDCEQRAHIGLAEIAKKQWRLVKASRMYKDVLEECSDSDPNYVFYRLGYCNVLKLMGKFEEAYSVVSMVIKDYPFAMQARYARSSILGLIGRAEEGLQDVPSSSASYSYGEWMRHYYRGLLLFRLGRYDDAHKNLKEEYAQASPSKEGKSLLRMAAVLDYLRRNETSIADKRLAEIPETSNAHIEYLSLVLKLHLATQEEDQNRIDSLKSKIIALQIIDVGLNDAVLALEKRDFDGAFNLEINALLRLAA